MNRTEARERRSWWVPALPLLVAQIALLILWDPLRSGVLFLFIMACGFGGMAWAIRELGKDVSQSRGGRRLTLRRMLGVALLLRVLALPLPATLSDDIYRYVWDGTVVLAGFNPYAAAPDAEALAPLRDEIWEKTAHRGVETVYPPAAEGLFSIAAATPYPLTVLKALIAGLDLLGCAGLWALARSFDVGRARTLAYAWNPLVVLEGAGMGHIDAAGVAATVIAVLALLRLRHSASSRAGRGRSVQAALAAAAGVLTKLVPVVALPLWILASGPHRTYTLLLLGVLAAAIVPVVVSTGGVPPGLVTYGISWEFNGPLFEPLYRSFAWLGVDAKLKALLEWVKHTVEIYEPLDRFYPFLYPQFLAKLVLAAGILVLVAQSLRERRDPVRASGRLLRRALLFSATFYPWYLTWALPWAALEWRLSWLALAASMQLAYLPRLFGVDYFPWVYLAVWAPFAAVRGWEHRGAERAGRSAP